MFPVLYEIFTSRPSVNTEAATFTHAIVEANAACLSPNSSQPKAEIKSGEGLGESAQGAL